MNGRDLPPAPPSPGPAAVGAVPPAKPDGAHDGATADATSPPFDGATVVLPAAGQASPTGSPAGAATPDTATTDASADPVTTGVGEVAGSDDAVSTAPAGGPSGDDVSRNATTDVASTTTGTRTADAVDGAPGDAAAPTAPPDAATTQVVPAAATTDVVPSDPASTPSTGAGSTGAGSTGAGFTDDATTVLPAVVQPTEAQPTAASDGDVPPADADEPTEVIDVAEARPRRRRRKALVLAGIAVVALLAVLYVADLALSSGLVPRGVTVAGQDVGGLAPAEAERRVRAAVEPRTTRPVVVAVGDVTSEIDPRTAGLSVDWAATIEQAGTQPLNPITRVRSFLTRREVGVVTVADQAAVDTALSQLVPIVNRPPAEGTVRFEGVTPVPVPPVDGQELDLPAAHRTLEQEWTNGSPVQLPVRVLPPITDADDVTAAIGDVATPAVSGPVTVQGEGVTGEITPEVIAAALSFRADPNADPALVPELNKVAIEEALGPQLASSEQPGRDAKLDFVNGRSTITPSQDGRGVDYDVTLEDLLTVLTKTGDERRITAVYAAQPAELTTEELNGLGITTVIGEFTTRGFAPDSGLNIRRAAQVIDGTIVQPGETFSLNAATSPRNAANGYVEAGIISEGVASRGIGGGVSQVATTLYNAAYFAGMTDVTHTPHSFYIGRYPPGREATVFEGSIDLKFRNDNPTGVLIETAWTPQSVTVRLYGTKRYDVTSSTGPRTNPTEPTQVDVPEGQPCVPTSGSPGFTVTDTRTLRDVRTGEVKTERRTTKYNPTPIVTCE